MVLAESGGPDEWESISQSFDAGSFRYGVDLPGPVAGLSSELGIASVA